MTQQARVVLQDCRHAIERHSLSMQAEEFRISWIAVVTLLRAVGHILKNVDSKQSEVMKRAVEQKWRELERSKPEPKIFWQFIYDGRNRFLKYYDHGVDRTLDLGESSRGTFVALDIGRSQGGRIQNLDTKQVISRLASGPYDGQDERKIAMQAYEWWRQYLDEVDALVTLLAESASVP